MQYLRVQYIASPNKWNLWQISSMVCLYVKPRYLENCHFFDLFWQTFARPLHGGVGFPFEICHVESTPVQINNMKKHTKKKHLRRASNNKCRMLITSLREEKMAQQCEPSSDWSFVCGKSVEGKKSVRYVHMYTIYKPGTQYRIEITTIQTVAMRLQYSVDTTIPTVSVVTRWTQWGHRGEGRLKQMETHYLRWSSTPANDIGVFNNREKLVGDKVIVISILHSRSKTTSSSWVQ